MPSMLELVLQTGRKARRTDVAEGQRLVLLIGPDVLDSAVQEMRRLGGFSFLDLSETGEAAACYGVRIVKTLEFGQLDIALLLGRAG